MNVRVKGLLKLIGGGVVAGLVFFMVLKNGLGNSSNAGPFQLIVMAIPGAFALVGLVELLSGIEFTKISSRWDELKGWQRGLLGLFVVALSFALVIAGVVLFA